MSENDEGKVEKKGGNVMRVGTERDTHLPNSNTQPTLFLFPCPFGLHPCTSMHLIPFVRSFPFFYFSSFLYKINFKLISLF